MGAFGLVQKQFFPTANRPELIVDLRLAQGASWAATDAEVKKLEQWLGDNPDVAYYTAYVGAGSPRFYLPTVPELANANFGQVIVMTKDLEARERVVGDARQGCSPRISRPCAPASSACRTARRSATP